MGNYFNEEHLKILSFNWEDLNDKTLRISVSKSIDGKVVCGKCKEDGKVYVLHMNINKEE